MKRIEKNQRSRRMFWRHVTRMDWASPAYIQHMMTWQPYEVQA